LCPDLFWRQQPGVQLTDRTDADWQRAFQLYKGFDEAEGVNDLILALIHLRNVPGCTGKVGTIGYCLGGKLAYLMAARSDADCNVGYYGVGIQDMLEEVPGIKKPLLLHVAENDKFVPVAAQKNILKTLNKHKNAEVHVY